MPSPQALLIDLIQRGSPYIPFVEKLLDFRSWELRGQAAPAIDRALACEKTQGPQFPEMGGSIFRSRFCGPRWA